MSAAHRATPVRSVRWRLVAILAAGAGVLLILGGVTGTPRTSASTATLNLGTAQAYAVLAGTTVTNTGPSTVSGNLGLYPGSSVTGFSGAPTGKVINGVEEIGNSTAHLAQTSLTTAYSNAAAAPSTHTVTAKNLAGLTLVAGVYTASSSMSLATGRVTLNGQHDPNSVFIFQAGSTLITGSHSTVDLINGAQACNVFWQVGSSATLGTTSKFTGSILALTSVTVTSGVTVTGRVLARNGAVTMIDDTITRPSACITATTTSSPSPTTTTTTTTTAPSTTTTTAPPSTTPTTSPSSTTPTTSPSSPSTPVVAAIPVGAPQTGLGGASRSGDNLLLVTVGGLALLGAGAAFALAIRRRRIAAHVSSATSNKQDGSG